MRGSIHAGTAGSPGLAWHLGPDLDCLLLHPRGGDCWAVGRSGRKAGCMESTQGNAKVIRPLMPRPDSDGAHDTNAVGCTFGLVTEVGPAAMVGCGSGNRASCVIDGRHCYCMV